MPRFRPRISLLTTLLLMTIVGMAIVTVRNWREIEPMRAEIRRLRQELGYLTVADDKKIYAIAVPTDDPDTHRYRIYIPKGKKLYLHTRIHTVPGRKAQSEKDWIASLLKSRSGSSGQIEPGEHTIDVKMRRNDPDKDDWTMVVTNRGGSGSSGTGSIGSKMPWLNDRRAWSHSTGILTSKQIEADPEVGLVVYTLRQGNVTETKGGYSTTSPDETKENPGVMLWIAPPSVDQ